MRKTIAISAVILLSALHCSATGNYSQQWQKATAFYDQKQYDSAAFYFEQIAALKPLNAELYYNLGNTYYRLNKVPQAVLNYERALHVNPEYKEARENLLLTQNRIVNHIQPVSDIFFMIWWQELTRPDKAGRWATWALVFFSLIFAVLIIRRFRGAGQGLPRQLPGIFGFLSCCFLVLAFSAARNSGQKTAAVVMQNDAPLMNNEQKGKPLSLVPEGTTVKIIGEKGMWVEVTLPDGRRGWLQQSLLDQI